jgi:hypothetical protein
MLTETLNKLTDIFFVQVLQKRSQSYALKDRGSTSASLAPFFVPQILVCIFKYIESCEDASARTKILSDLLDLLDSNPSNVESLMVLSNTISLGHEKSVFCCS